tara:strand:- start:687 stop:1295 length:609 start_codon:yes stop_codon:yes gene_type:complete
MLKKKVIGIVSYNYSSGNIWKIENCIKNFKHKYYVTNQLNDLKSCTHLILPGVGKFDTVINSLKKNNIINFLRNLPQEKKILGICIGSQILFESSEEGKKIQGLSHFKGKIYSFKRKPILNIGKKEVLIKKKSVFKKFNKKKFYFLHGFYPKLGSFTNGVTIHEKNKFSSIVVNKNCVGVQFHPELSGNQGLEFINTFLNKF